jgi:hypothetical protein
MLESMHMKTRGKLQAQKTVHISNHSTYVITK